MTIDKISIRNYQSLHEVDIDLSPFTVIVGQTSSGKSAFTRALKTLIANQRGNAFISHGQSACTLQAVTSDGRTVTLVRGRTSAHDGYTIAHGEEQQRFTKLGGSVPPEVTAALGIDPTDPLTFATQFDRPYLLADSPGQVAQTFGALTRVSIIFEAVREAKKQRSTATTTLRTRAGDLAALQERVPGIRTLAHQKAALARAEHALEQAQAKQHEADRIALLEDTATRAADKISQAGTRTVPNISDLEQTGAALARLVALLGTMRLAQQTLRDVNDRSIAAQQEAQAAEQEYTEALRAAGTCPTCEQSTSGIGHVHAA